MLVQRDSSTPPKVVVHAGCPFCDEMHGTLTLPGLEAGRVILHNEHWMVLPSLGPLRVDHLLVVPRFHFRSAASAVRFHGAATMLSALALIKDRSTILQDRGLMILEHGESDSGVLQSGACIEHAHLHVVPADRSDVRRVLYRFDDWTLSGDSIDSLLFAAPEAYHLVGFQSVDHSYAVRSITGPCPSQLLRRLAADALGCSGRWNWRTNPDMEEVRQTALRWGRAEPYPAGR